MCFKLKFTMSIKNLLQSKLKDKLSEEKLEKLPSGYQKIGNIIILKLKENLPANKIAEVLLEKIPNTRLICRYTGKIKGEYRKPQIKILAGKGNTETIHKEHGCKYKLDVKKIMWSKGNLEERMRIAELVEDGETIVDFFSGIGYFSIPIAVHSKPEIIYSIEKNLVAYKYLKENIKLNKVQEKIKPILGDCSEEGPRLGKIGDRVIMGFLPSPKKHLPAAIKVLKGEGILHYEAIGKNPEELVEEVKNSVKKKFEVKNISKVKSYAPKIYHYTLDLIID